MMLDRTYETPPEEPGTKHIKLGKGKFAIVDAEDYEELNKSNWYCDAKGYGVRHGPRINGKQLKVYMHQALMGTPDDMQTDHINRNRLDNRRTNLRVVTPQQNSQNQSKQVGGSSIYKGVTWHKANSKWQAQISVNNKRLYLGLFDSEVDAARTYNLASRKYFGEYGCRNFPDIEGDY